MKTLSAHEKTRRGECRAGWESHQFVSQPRRADAAILGKSDRFLGAATQAFFLKQVNFLSVRLVELSRYAAVQQPARFLLQPDPAGAVHDARVRLHLGRPVPGITQTPKTSRRFTRNECYGDRDNCCATDNSCNAVVAMQREIGRQADCSESESQAQGTSDQPFCQYKGLRPFCCFACGPCVLLRHHHDAIGEGGIYLTVAGKRLRRRDRADVHNPLRLPLHSRHVKTGQSWLVSRIAIRCRRRGLGRLFRFLCQLSALPNSVIGQLLPNSPPPSLRR